uniref:Putative endonuclease 4 n=1 Tax=Lygus hesperus TaxID=30085 RepID=A0A0A9W6T3_LYGHE
MANLLYLGRDDEEKEVTSSVIQNVLMCCELLPVALMHRAAFGRDKLDEEMANVPVYMKNNSTGDFRNNVDTALKVNDIIDDTLGTIFYRRGKLVDQENVDESLYGVDEDTDTTIVTPGNGYNNNSAYAHSTTYQHRMIDVKQNYNNKNSAKDKIKKAPR